MAEIQNEQNIQTSNNTPVDENQNNDKKNEKYIILWKRCSIIWLFLLFFSDIFLDVFSWVLSNFLRALFIIWFFLFLIWPVFRFFWKYKKFGDEKRCNIIWAILLFIWIYSDKLRSILDNSFHLWDLCLLLWLYLLLIWFWWLIIWIIKLFHKSKKEAIISILIYWIIYFIYFMILFCLMAVH